VREGVRDGRDENVWKTITPPTLSEEGTERVRVKDGVATGGTEGEAACILVEAVVVGGLCMERRREGGREGGRGEMVSG